MCWGFNLRFFSMYGMLSSGRFISLARRSAKLNNDFWNSGSSWNINQNKYFTKFIHISQVHKNQVHTIPGIAKSKLNMLTKLTIGSILSKYKFWTISNHETFMMKLTVLFWCCFIIHAFTTRQVNLATTLCRVNLSGYQWKISHLT